MGDVLAFADAALLRRPRSRPLADRDGEAEILFFTGVRYERHVEVDCETDAPRDGASEISKRGPRPVGGRPGGRGRKRA